jgi:hypothetical protein
MLLTIDPGNATGWALWRRDGLTGCGLGDPRSACDVDWIEEVWIESPVIYPRSKARPNDIVLLARGAGEWGGRYESEAAVHYVEPATWKGQLPKDVHHARIWSKLNAAEQAIVNAACRGMAPSKRHNVLDAVGIGLWVRGQK